MNLDGHSNHLGARQALGVGFFGPLVREVGERLGPTQARLLEILRMFAPF